MSVILDFISDNYQWLFSGLGVFIISMLVVKKIYHTRTTVETRGKNSPGIVIGNYTVSENERKRNNS